MLPNVNGGGSLYIFKKKASPSIDFYGFSVNFINTGVALVYCRHFVKP